MERLKKEMSSLFEDRQIKEIRTSRDFNIQVILISKIRNRI